MEPSKLCFLILCAFTIGQGVQSFFIINAINSGLNAKEKCPDLEHTCNTKGLYCLNGGTCNKMDSSCSRDSFRCICQPNYTGAACEQLICKYDAKWLQELNCDCQNGGICKKVEDACSIESYKCECVGKYEGAFCQTRISRFEISPNGHPASEAASAITSLVATTTPSATKTTVTIASAITTTPPLTTTVSATPAAATGATTNLTTAPTTTRKSTTTTTAAPTATIVTTSTRASEATTTAESTTVTTQTTIPTATIDTTKPTLSSVVTTTSRMTASAPTPTTAATTRSIAIPERLNNKKPKTTATPTTTTAYATTPKSAGTTPAITVLDFTTTTALTTAAARTTTHSITTTSTTTNQKISTPKSLNINIMCPEGFICANGDCDPEVLDKRTPPKCVCNPGWIGEHCDTQCEMKCENGGLCEISDGEPVCRCTPGFVGKTCNIPEVKKESITILKDIYKSLNPEAKVVPVGKTFPRSALKTITKSDPCNRKCGFGFKCEIQMLDGVLQPNCVSIFRKLLFGTASFKPAVLHSPANPKMCAANFICQHGICDRRILRLPRCLCDKGYQGAFCHIKCDKICLNGGRCSALGTPRKQFCTCPILYTGQFCQNVKTPIQRKQIFRTARDIPLETTQPTATTITTSSTTTEAFGADDDAKKCSNNFVCVHGVCDKTDPDSPWCICEDGFIGTFCHVSCTKPCTNGGRCLVLQDTERCNCPINFQGEFCQNERNK